MITKVGDDPFGPYVRARAARVRRRRPLGRHAPDAAHAGRVLRDLPARRLPAAVLPRAAGAGHDARAGRARPRRDPRRARVLDDRDRSVGRAEPRGDARRARRPRRRHHDPRPRPPADVLGRRRPRPGAGRARRCAHATVAVGNRDEVAVAVGTREPDAAADGAARASASSWRSSSAGPTACSRARATSASRSRRCRSRSSAGSARATRSAARSCTGCWPGWPLERDVRLRQRGGRARRRAARLRRRDADPRRELEEVLRMRLTVAQALVRFLAAQHVERDGERAALLRRLPRHLRPRQRRRPRPGAAAAPRPAAVPPGAQRAGDGPPRRPATRASATGCGAFACTSSVGPGATNMVTGAALATINRLPVLLLPGDTFADARAAPGAAAARGAARRHGLGQRLLPAGVALLRPHRRGPSSCRRRARGDARADRPGRDRRGPPRAARGRADRGVRGPGRRSSRSATWTVYRRPPAPDALARAAALIRAARRPLVVAGGGVIYAEATAALRAFADATGIPVAETQAGRGALPSDAPARARRDRRDRHAGRQPAGARGRPRDRRRHALERLHDRVEVGLPGPGRALRRTSTSRRSTPPSTAGLALEADARRRARRAARRARRPPRRRGVDRARGARRPRRGPRRSRALVRAGHGPLPSQAEVIGAVNDAAGRARRGRLRGRLDARRPAQAVARARPRRQGLPRRVRLLVHGLRDPGRRWASSSPRPSARCS